MPRIERRVAISNVTQYMNQCGRIRGLLSHGLLGLALLSSVGFAAAKMAQQADHRTLQEEAAAFHVSPQRLQESRRYLYGGILWGSVADFWLMAALAWLVLGGHSARLRTWAKKGRGTEPDEISSARTIAIYSFALLTFLLLAELPWSVGLGFFRERAYGFEHRTLTQWCGDWGKSYVVSVIVGVLLIEAAYALARKTGRRWWLWVWAVCAIFALAGTVLEPVVVEPLFNHFTPIQNVALRDRILAMAHRAGVPADNVYEVNRSRQSGHTNAYVTGVLGSQRIVIYDTLLQSETPDEIMFTVGHEIGHYVLHHVWKGYLFGIALLGFFLFIASRIFNALTRNPRYRRRTGIASIADAAALPLILLLLIALAWLAQPIENAFSRWEEHQADAFGLRICPNPVAAVTGFEKDVRTDLIAPDPPRWVEWWFFTHPSDLHRIEYAERYCARHGIEVPPDVRVP
jgi:STE24 endopeptidase